MCKWKIPPLAAGLCGWMIVGFSMASAFPNQGPMTVCADVVTLGRCVVTLRVHDRPDATEAVAGEVRNSYVLLTGV